MVASSAPLSLAPPSRDPGTASTLPVAFPASACTTAESAVFVDEDGRFVGAVAPGTAATLVLAPDSKRLFVVGSFDVTAPPRTWFVRHEVPRRPDQGVIVAVEQADGHNCEGKWSGPLLPRPKAATLAEVAKAAQGLRRLETAPGEGNRWLDEHRERVNELIGRVEEAPPGLEPVTTETLQVR